MRILVTGLPGSGKTTLAEKITEELKKTFEKVYHCNADQVREKAEDWDFSEAGRLRQLERMTSVAKYNDMKGFITVCDFICPKQSYRDFFQPDVTIWTNTIQESVFPDTNDIFEPCPTADVVINDFDDEKIQEILNLINLKKDVIKFKD